MKMHTFRDRFGIEYVLFAKSEESARNILYSYYKIDNVCYIGEKPIPDGFVFTSPYHSVRVLDHTFYGDSL